MRLPWYTVYTISMNQKEWLNAILDALQQTNEIGAATVAYLRKQRTPLGLRKLPWIFRHAGAMWVFLNRGIYINEHYFTLETPPNHPRVLSLMVHETRHLQQGMRVALSVYGELDAWQVDFNFQKSLTGRYPDSAIQELCSLPLRLDRSTLERARTLMIAYGGPGYRADLLPLFPIDREVQARLRRS